MRPEKPSLRKWEHLFLYVFMLALVVLSVLFYKERILFNDTLKLLTDMMYHDHPVVTTNRYISIFAELLPFAAYKANASLNLVLILYSLNLILLPVMLALISLRWFRETRTAWSLLLFYTILSIKLFYYPVSEFQYGLGFFLFYIGLCDFAWRSPAPVRPWTFWLLSLFFIPTIIFSHPLSFLVFVAWLALRLALHPAQWRYIGGVGILGIIAQGVKAIFFSAAHDANKAKQAEALRDFNYSFLDGELANGFYKALRDDYFLIPILLLLAAGALLYLRKYLAAVLLTGIIVAFWLLVTVSLHGDPYWYYTEHIYQPVTFFIALGAGRYFTLATRRLIYLPVLVLTLIISINKIYLGHGVMTSRLDWYRNCFRLMDTKGITKGIVGIDYMDIGWHMAANWWTQYESAYLYALEQPGTTKTVTMVWNQDNARPVIQVSDALLGVNLDHWPVAAFPKQYFHFDSSQYVILTDEFTNEQVRGLSYEHPGKTDGK